MTHQGRARGACKHQAREGGRQIPGDSSLRMMAGLVLVLSLALLALADTRRAPLQQKALDLVLEDFHSRPNVQAAFKEQAVTEAVEMEFPMGTFVQLEVYLVQTFCGKQQRETQNCRIKPGGRKQKCLACFKFDSNNPANVLDKSLRCLSEQNPIFQEVKRRQERDCEAVRGANEGHYQPGVFAFSKGLPVASR